MNRRNCSLGLFTWLLQGLHPAQASLPGVPGPSAPPAPAQPAAPLPTPPARPPRADALVLGDSISAEYGLPRGSGWVALLAAQWPQRRIVNASLSGDTSAGALARLPALLRSHRPQVLLIEIGGNDALRGLALAQTRANLLAMADLARAAGARVLLCGMQVPPNYGAAYAQGFAAVYADVARSRKLRLLPFLLAGVADDPDPLRWFQPDGIHPNAAAQARIAAHVAPPLKALLP